MQSHALLAKLSHRNIVNEDTHFLHAGMIQQKCMVLKTIKAYAVVAIHQCV